MKADEQYRAAEALLTLEGVAWDAGGRRILGPLDLTVQAGECVAIVGPNGAGKTTLLRIASGLLRPAQGEVRLRNASLGAMTRKDIAKRLAYVPQLRPDRIPLTVEQVVLLGRYPYLGRAQLGPSPADFGVVADALAQVGLERLRHRQVDELSGGEQQSVFIASALAQEAELLVLDEPTTHLDPQHQREIAQLIRSFHRDRSRTVLTSTHDLNFASLVADRVVALADGEILAIEPPSRAMQPELLERLFGAPFEVVRHGERPMTVLELDG